jgi:hypothetical protein
MSAVALVAAFTLLAPATFAKKTDVVHIANGNVLVGEIKRLGRGILDFKVDHMGTPRIQWKYVVRLTSDQQLQIEVVTGHRYYGSLIESSADGRLRIVTMAGTYEVEISDVVIIEPIKGSFWKRLDGSVNTGISFTKSTDLLQFNLGGSVLYRARKYVTDLTLNSIITSKSGERSRTNSDLQFTYLRLLKNKWFARGDTGASKNDELGIDLRVNVAGGGGRRVVQTNNSLFLVSGLLSANQENTSDGETSNNLELVFDTSFQGFRYDTPKFELKADLSAFYNLTTGDRFRVEFNGRVSLELVKDFFWDISQVYYRFDSDPPETAASRDDYGIISGLRYTF